MITVTDFGRLPDGTRARLFTLENRAGMKVRVSDFGGLLVAVETPDRRGDFANVNLGCRDFAGWLENPPYLGAPVGRVAGRIAGGRFALDGKTFQLPLNSGGKHHLHGGVKGFHKVLWEAEPVELVGAEAVKFSRRSPDGEEGYPGTLDAAMQYLLDDAGDLRIEYAATADRATPASFTHHAYFNLTGCRRDVLGHVLAIPSARYVEGDAELLPTGKFLPVAGTPYDFTVAKPVGRDIAKAASGTTVPGYDLSYLIDRPARVPRALVGCAKVHDPDSGRSLETFTDQAVVHFYSGNFLDGTVCGPEGTAWKPHWGLCFETEGIPGAVNQPSFPSVILRPGEVYRQTCVYRFSVE